ncbi:MAG TPA: M15 family metallopeptidase, partial [Gemmatimonadales bacterium]|nr:M15 family metallopeptidase [Gemmatimonadales bacterium]
PRFQPGNDKSWSPHRLDRPGAINALFAEVLAETGRRLNRAAPAIDQLIVAGHSRAFGILYPLARASASPELGKGALARLSRIWALDATYGKPPIAAFESLTKAKQGLGVEIVYRAKSATDKFKGASRAGALALRPIPRSITHCAVPGWMLPALLAELPPPRPEALDAGSEAEDLWAETPGSGWSESGVTETEWLEAEADALDRFDTLDSQTWDESHTFGESGAFEEASLESEDESPDRFDELGDGRNSEWESDEAEPEEEALDEESVESQELFEAEEFARHALYEVGLDEDEIELGSAAEESPAEAPSSRPRNLTSSQVRKAWRAYAGAKHRMVPLRLFGRWNPPVNPLTVDAWRALERALGASNYDVHRAWVFVGRSIAGTQTHSLHAYGLAIDIDHAKPTCNVNRATPDHRKVRFSSAATKEGRCQDVRDRKADTSFTRDQVAAVEAIRTVDGHQVFVWGGRWQNIKDTMHFEINVTPDELARGLQPDPGHRLQLADPAGEFEEEYLEVDASMSDVSLGTLTFSAPGWKAFTYRFTAEDLVWAARFMAGEAGGVDNLENRAVLWLMFNRYAYFRHEHPSWGTFGDFIRRYSTPLQPYLYSLGAAKRHWRKCNSSYTNCDYVPMAERYGYYKSTQIPRGQLRQFIKLQQRPWSKLPASARDLALRALQGAIPNLIGTASEFDDTATYYKDDNGERPTRQQWLDYTKDFAAKKQYLW